MHYLNIGVVGGKLGHPSSPYCWTEWFVRPTIMHRGSSVIRPSAAETETAQGWCCGMYGLGLVRSHDGRRRMRSCSGHMHLPADKSCSRPSGYSDPRFLKNQDLNVSPDTSRIVCFPNPTALSDWEIDKYRLSSPIQLDSSRCRSCLKAA